MNQADLFTHSLRVSRELNAQPVNQSSMGFRSMLLLRFVLSFFFCVFCSQPLALAEGLMMDYDLNFSRPQKQGICITRSDVMLESKYVKGIKSEGKSLSHYFLLFSCERCRECGQFMSRLRTFVLRSGILSSFVRCWKSSLIMNFR